MRKYDSIIIGAGQAGPFLAPALAGAGEKVALIERDRIGGTCVNTGCTPTKIMVASARAAYISRRADDFGVVIPGEVSVDMKKVKERRDGIVNKYLTGLNTWMDSTENLDLYRVHARFVDDHVIQVGDETITADKVFINVGGTARIIDGVKGTPYLTNESIMDLDNLPEHIVVVGGGYIGLEFAQMFRRFGSEVTLIDRHDRVLHREDPDVSERVQQILENEGVKFRLNAECINAKMKGDSIAVGVVCEVGDPEVMGTHLLMAAGRIPNTFDLGLENTAIEPDDQGYIPVNSMLETSSSGVYALGDCNGRGGFTHTTYNDFEVVFNHLKGDKTRYISDRILAYNVYIDPPLARIGMTETQALRSGKKILRGYREMTDIARAVEKSEDQGFIKILIDADTNLILGATILGIGGDEIIHSLLDVMYAEKPYTLIKNAVHIHPTVSELIPTILGELESIADNR